MTPHKILPSGVWTEVAYRSLGGGIWHDIYGAPLTGDQAMALAERKQIILMHRRCKRSGRCIMVVTPARPL